MARARRLLHIVAPRLAFVLAATALVTACEKQPAKIRIKLPREAVQSVKMEPVLPPFEKKGDTIKLRASAFDKGDVYMGTANVKWSVADSSVASVNYEGVVTILSSGETKVIAEGQGYEQKLTAELPIKAVIIEKIKIVAPRAATSCTWARTKQYKAEVLDDRGNVVPDAKVTWRTSDFAATVTVTGEVEGRAMGDTQIVAEVGALNDRYNRGRAGLGQGRQVARGAVAWKDAFG
jgi:hypothetical protein